MIHCGACRSKKIEPRNARGRGFPYKFHKKVILTVELDLLTCIDCGNIILKVSDCKRLDEAIEKSLAKLEKQEQTMNEEIKHLKAFELEGQYVTTYKNAQGCCEYLRNENKRLKELFKEAMELENVGKHQMSYVLNRLKTLEGK